MASTQWRGAIVIWAAFCFSGRVELLGSLCGRHPSPLRALVCEVKTGFVPRTTLQYTVAA